MITVNLDEIRPTVVACLAEGLRRIEAEGLIHASSFGAWFDAYQGAFGISVNENDDDSYRCQSLSSYSRRHWHGIMLETLRNFEQDHYNLPDESETIAVIVNGVTQECAELHDYFELCHCECSGWVKAFFESLPPGGWRPVWIQVEGSGNEAKYWKCKDGPPPPSAPDWAAEPLVIHGFKPPAKGLKVFKLSTGDERYASIHMEEEDRDVRMSFDGISRKANFIKPHPVQCFGEEVRFGGLAGFSGSGVFALLESRPQFRDAVNFLDPWVEFLPVFSAGHSWQLVHALDPISVLNHKASRFGRIGDKIYDVEVGEFDPNLLRQFGRPIFKLAEALRAGPFFLETEETESFLQLCQRIGLRGIEFEMVWCEDLTIIVEQLGEFLCLVDARLRRLHPGADIAKWMNIECLSGIQSDIWRIGTFRKLARESGVAEAVRQVQGLRSLRIPCIHHLIPNSWNYSNTEKTEHVVRELEPVLEGREILEEMRGFFCRYLPKALKDLKEMEARNSGRMAVYGPTV